MRSGIPYALLADIVLTLHVAVVVFVVGGLVLVVAGNLRGWRWVNALWFRVTHLSAIVFVVAETWLGLVCPLTTLEWWLRAQAGAVVEGKSFIGYWLQRLLYYDVPWWVFAVGYSLFGLLVLASWLYFPPGGRPRRNAAEGKGAVD